ERGPDAPALQVTLSSPAERARIEQESVAVAGVVSASRGIARITVTLNGTEVTRREEKPPARAVPLNLPVTLREGANTRVATATDVDGAVQQEVRTVEMVRSAPLAIAKRYPEDRARVSEESSVVAAVVTSSQGIAQVTVSLNGLEVARQSERTPPTSLVVTAP